MKLVNTSFYYRYVIIKIESECDFMFDCLKNGDLVITQNKRNLLKKINEKKVLLSLKIMSLDEFKKKYFGTYQKEAIDYLIRKYHYKYDVAKIYLDHFYFLKDLKKELEENHLIKIEPLLKESIKRIVIDSISIDPYLLKELKPYEVIFLEEQNHYYNHKVYAFDDIEQEINHVALSIMELLKSVKYHNIKLVNVGNEYKILLKTIFSFYHLPININQDKKIYGLLDTKKFLQVLKETLDYEKALASIRDPQLYSILLSICNEYHFRQIDPIIIYCIEEEIKRKTIVNKRMKNAIEIVDIDNINNDDHYFILGFNQGILPKNYKDEDYFSDSLKKRFGIMTSLEKNKIEKEILKKKITNYPNIYLSYKLKSSFENYYPSSFIEEMGLEIGKGREDHYNYSHIYNKLRLAKSLDRFIKYNEYNQQLEILYTNYPNINYLTYDNRYKKIRKDQFFSYINHKLLLSYSSLDHYYKCGFRYYLSNILKLEPYEETFMTYIGNLFHDVLSKAFQEDFNFEQYFSEYVKNRVLTAKEAFFINQLKKDLVFTIDIIRKQNETTKLKQALYEQKIYINKDRNIKVTFMGIIDKLIYQTEDNQTVVAIIDYKTGNPNITLDNTIYGLEMQLPIYLYLTKNSKLKHVKIGGFYLQKIIHPKLAYQMNKNTLEEKEKRYRLEGYSNSNPEILKLVDKNYHNSTMIKGMKTSSKGFYAYAKVLDEKQIDGLNHLVDDKIDQAITSILETDFSINPKKIGQDLIGCTFCKFKDICYRKEEDIVHLKEQSYEEFLGGEVNA